MLHNFKVFNTLCGVVQGSGVHPLPSFTRTHFILRHVSATKQLRAHLRKQVRTSERRELVYTRPLNKTAQRTNTLKP